MNIAVVVSHVNMNNNHSRIEVLHSTEVIIDTYLHILRNADRRWNYFADVRTLSIAPFSIEPIKRAMLDARKTRGTILRFITEITKDNISYCKQIMENVELRHLDGVKGNFGVSDTEYIAISATLTPTAADDIPEPASTTTATNTRTSIPHAVYSNVKEDVQQQQYIFEILWNKATVAEQRIREIHEGIVHYQTRIIEDSQEIIKEISRLTASSNELYTCLTPGGIQYSYNYFFHIKKKLLHNQKHKGIKYISNIDKDNLEVVKILLDVGIQVRHVKNLPPMSFGVSDKEIAATIEKMEGGRMVQSLLLSNERVYVNHFKSIFEELWENGIDAEHRIKDIEAGAHLEDIEVIQSSSRARELYLSLLKSATKEVLLVFATTGAFVRQEKLGVIKLCKEAAKERNVSVRILMPPDNTTKQTVHNLRLNHRENMDIRYIGVTSSTKATMLFVDRKVSLVMELRDDSKATFDEAVGLSTYSNSRSGVLSYVSIFENLWMQTELYEQVKKANERLKEHDKQQQEFINVAAHELRSPVQPILGVAEILRSRKRQGDGIHNKSLNVDEEYKLLDIIVKNAKKLLLLEDNILDVARIENKSLMLNIEESDLDILIATVVQDIRDQIDNSRIKLQYNKTEGIIFLVRADKPRLVQVISNLLSNSIKFTKEGMISVNLEKKENQAVVAVKDTGHGISADILPKLFSKFTTKSEQGVGLGLFICKTIVEAHGGTIWAENNKEGKGATFTFRLPLEC
jgi:signal transduction histidine kinase